MGAGRLLSWSLLIVGLASLAYAGVQGDLEVFLVLVVPVVSGSGPLAALGMLATILGVAGLLWTQVTSSPARRQVPPDRRPPEGFEARGGPGGEDRDTSKPKTRGGGVILIGPIPIAWGSDRTALGWVLVAAIVLTGAAIALTFVLRG